MLTWFKKAQQGDVLSKRNLGTDVSADLNTGPSRLLDQAETIRVEQKHHKHTKAEGAFTSRAINEHIEVNGYFDRRQEEEEEFHLEGESKEEEEEMSQGKGENEADLVETNTVIQPKFRRLGLGSESEPAADSTVNEKSSDVEEVVVPTRRTYSLKQRLLFN